MPSGCSSIRHWALLSGELGVPEAERLAIDNLNTDGIESPCETFAPQNACQLAERLESHYTPTHGSWLNITETKLSIHCG